MVSSIHVVPGSRTITIKRGKVVVDNIYAWVATPYGLLVARYGAGVFVYGGMVYVVGGVTERGVTGVVEAVDVLAGERRIVSQMPEPRAHFGYAWLNDRFYVFGGIDRGGVPRSEIFEYNPRDNSWARKDARLPVGVAHLAATPLGDKVLVCGGVSEKGEVVALAYLYDPAADVLTRVTDMNVARENHACAQLNGRAYCFGGDNGVENLDTVEAYDPSKNTWTLLDVKLPEPMTAVRATVISRGNKQLVFVVGG